VGWVGVISRVDIGVGAVEDVTTHVARIFVVARVATGVHGGRLIATPTVRVAAVVVVVVVGTIKRGIDVIGGGAGGSSGEGKGMGGGEAARRKEGKGGYVHVWVWWVLVS